MNAINNSSAASKVAQTIRARIISGVARPGSKLPEERVRAELNVSRSTLREGLQLLVRERLVEHILSRGFFVRMATRNDVEDLFTARQAIECGALTTLTRVGPIGISHLRKTVADGTSAAESRDWQSVAAASVEFHSVLIDLAGSTRLNELGAQILTEFRLAYAYMVNPEDFHVRFLERHTPLIDLVENQDFIQAAEDLRIYLVDSRDALLPHIPA